MAEDDDDESFGDFTFASASYPSSFQFNHQQPSSQINGPKSTTAIDMRKQGEADDDDEWGDFVETRPGSAASSGSLSKPVDPFNFFASNPSFQSKSQLESSGLSVPEPEKKTTHWVKIKGAIPLSIFGDAVEEENHVEERPGVVDSQGTDGKDSGSNVISTNYGVSNGSKGNANLGVGMSYDIIANLYNTNHKILDNGFSPNVNVLNPNTNGVDSSKKESSLVLSGVSLDSGSAAHGRDSDTQSGLSNQNQNVNFQDGARLNGIRNLNLDVFNMDFSGWNIGLKSDSDMIGTNSNQIELKKTKSGSYLWNSNGLDLNLTQKRSSSFDGWNFNVDGFKPDSDVLNQDFHVSSANANCDPDDDDDDDGGWEFKDAYAEQKVNHGNKQAESKENDVLEGNTNPKEFIKNSNGSIDLFSMSSEPFNLFSTSDGISGSSNNLAVGLDSKPSTAVESGSGLDTYVKKEETESNGMLDFLVGGAQSQEDFGEFAAAFEETGPRNEAEPRLHDSARMNASAEFNDFSIGSTDFFADSTGSIDLFSPVNGDSDDLNKVDVKVDTGPSVVPKVEAAHSDYSFEMSSRSEKTSDQNVLDSHVVVGDAVFDDDFGEFTTASAENGGKQEGTEIRGENHKGPLPLAIFCDEEPEHEDSLEIPNVFLHQSESYKRNNHSPNTSISLNDIISNLYTHAEQISSVDDVNKPTQNGSVPSEDVLNSSVAQDIDDFDDCSWEFKDASFAEGAENRTSLHNNGNADDGSCSTQLKLNRYVDFYSKLMDVLQFLAKCHLESLKEAQTTATASEGVNLTTTIEEIQEAYSESGPKDAISKTLEDHTGKESDLSGLLKVLQEPGFDILESEYSLQTELHLVKQDSAATMQLIKHAKTMLKLLQLGSAEEQLTYVSIWSKMISVCTEELRYGAQIWRQSLEKEVHSAIHTDPQGKRFLLSLGEVYRVAIILEASIRLYKPWTLFRSLESSSMYHLLDECHALWHSSGLAEAVLSIPASSSLDGDNNASLLVESIKYIRNLDGHTLEKHVFTDQQPLCRLSLLTSSVVPGMAFVEWDGMVCFVKLANLWANLISKDVPKLPSLLVNC